MGSVGGQTVVCVKQVKQNAEEEWDENMPLPGDIIEGFAERNAVSEEGDEEEVFVAAKAKWELSAQLGKISHQQQAEEIWVRVRRGEESIKLRARIAQDKSSMLHRRFTIRAADDERHVAVLSDLTLDQCYKLQEMSRTVVNSNGSEFNKRGIRYDWKEKVESHLLDQRCTVISSVLFMPLKGERTIQPTTSRCMAWFTAAVSTGVPLVFVNIQTEQIISNSKEKEKEKISCNWQQNQTSNIQIAQAIRLWFLPGIREVFFRLIPEQGEERFGMNIRRTEEGFIYVFSVTKGSAADRAGLGGVYEEACGRGQLVAISRVEGKSVMPSSACWLGLLKCCDHVEIRDTLVSAIRRMDWIDIHVMAWPNLTLPSASTPPGLATLNPPDNPQQL